ncbi:hypothetical protein BAUCODRAFT_69184 [Baudoinia panamericana UAMH 10762]|uniref:Uncharacterized protein n=1 Tax=Baudoinia panamericana (strain UAMH 10762) TaxID=717646 RepID=M2NDN8_BAUPA|nr:uncharacterized protein BAUCODRAFT_69184 [Baudoinia panamericana UAMH 10762]EMC97339.1 hypothetical protein BAUCODRAFT_69184 [Baudoinia panamericana UAMH 10762]
MAEPSNCHHTFKIAKSNTTLIVWKCQVCDSGPHWYIYQCTKCGLKTCQPCATTGIPPM